MKIEQARLLLALILSNTLAIIELFNSEYSAMKFDWFNKISSTKSELN
jgi:hypothetical protein